MVKDRVLYLDAVKLVAMYLIIIVHVIASMVDGWAVGGNMIEVIRSFVVPLFILMSGYFISDRLLQKPFLELLKDKARQLLLPTITCTIICCLYLFFCKDVTNFRDELIGNSWFLKVLFVYYIFFWLLKRAYVNDWILTVLSCTLLFVIPGGSALQLNYLWPCFIGGYFLKKYDVLRIIAGSWLMTALFLVMFILGYMCQLHFDIPNFIPISIDTMSSGWYFIVCRYFVIFCGCMSVILLLSLADKYYKKAPYFIRLASLGKYTLGIYVLQTILVINVFPDTLAWYVESELLLDAVVAPLLSVGFLALCLWLIYWLSKNKTIDLLMFGGLYYKR